MVDMNTFWRTLPRPLLGLAPMNGITDHPFRHIQKRHGRPHVLYTEFTSVSGSFTRDGRLLQDFRYDEAQRPILGQIFGRAPAHFRQMAVLLCQLGFDGIDINMGCPTRSVAHSGAGAALIKTPELAQAIVRAVQEGIDAWCNGATVRDCPGVPGFIARLVEARAARLPPAAQVRRPIPVSVKTRIGYDAPQVAEWIPRLLETEPAAIAIHGRTLRQGYGGHADWEEIGRAAELIRAAGVVALGNGDVQSRAEAARRCAEYGLDGVLIGRAACGNPFVFLPAARPVPDDWYLRAAIEHAALYAEAFSALPYYHFLPMRKHLAWYASHLAGGAALRRRLLQVHDVQAAIDILQEVLAHGYGDGLLMTGSSARNELWYSNWVSSGEPLQPPTR
jgi:tRNA-dihydrouridine synthase